MHENSSDIEHRRQRQMDNKTLTPNRKASRNSSPPPWALTADLFYSSVSFPLAAPHFKTNGQDH
jgi:hypothetical protein